MAISTSYGLGQYRFNKNYEYITKLTNGEEDKNYCDTNSSYEDIAIKLPNVSIEENGSIQSVVQFGYTYYMRLTLPQNRQYSTTLNLKLCPSKNGSIDLYRYQHIKQLIIPPTPANDDNISHVILYEVPNYPYSANNKEVIKAQVMDEFHDLTLWTQPDPPPYNIGELYYLSPSSYKKLNTNSNSNNYLKWETYSNGEQSYYYRSNDNIWLKVNNSSEHFEMQGWKEATNNSETTIVFDFVFSPKYNLTGGYDYLLLEIDRSEAIHQGIQYINDNGETKYGLRIDKSKIVFELYAVNNLLEKGNNGYAQIQSGTRNLSHMAIHGHPEQILAINGEEIKIGQTGFYELKDFNITFLGVVVNDKEKDRFIIDYEYRVT